MSEIRVFHSHIEVYPYEKGDFPKLEKMLSKYVKLSPTYGQYVPEAFFIQNSILYLPRGVNLSLLANFFRATPTIVNKHDPYVGIQKGIMKVPPKSKIQEESLDFLLSKGKFVKGEAQSQFALNLDQGLGKTYCMTNAILQMKMRAIVIVHKDKLKQQWIATMTSMSSLPEDRICDISSTTVIEQIMKGKIIADVYYITHQLLASYARSHSWTAIHDFFKKIKVGVKVIDEAHKFFENTLMIDYFSNVKKTFYITATFSRADASEVRLFKTAFSSAYKFGEETVNYEENRKHIKMFIVYYHSKPTVIEKSRINTIHGFSAYNFINYALNESNHTMMKVLQKILATTENLKGKTLIISPKVDSVEYIADYLTENLGKNVGTIHSKNGKKKNEENYNKDIISSTVKSIGEGDDIKGLRVLINLEPIGSKVLADQLRGRLREYSKEDDTFFFYPIDTSIPECTVFLKRILPVMKKKCKEIVYINMDDV